jgi:peptidoglycan glycosyltransferase
VNRPLRRVAFAVLILFGALLLRANWVQVVRGDAYANDSRNSRVLLRTYEQERGPISVLNGTEQTPIARSEDTGGRLRYLRQYAQGPQYAHVTGFVSLVYGTPQGVERAENDLLTGNDDRLFVGRLSDYVTGREPSGGSVLLSINPAAQAAAVEGLAGKRGAAVALDPRTGAVLAMVSAPSFDPSRLSSHTPADIRAYYDELTNDPGQPLVNRAISSTYPPGSTFKVVTAAAALESGAVTVDTPIPSPRELDLPQTGANLRNFGGSACSGETSTLPEAMRISCNTAFGSLGLTMPENALREQALAFGFGEDDLSAPTRVAASQYPEETNPPQAAQSAIGQFDVRATPLQMAMVAAGIANDGEVMRPYLVAESQAPDLTRLSRQSPDALSRATSPETAEQITAMMELVVADGSGTAAQIDGVRVAGKTGTAQHAQGRPPHAWFIGFAPAEDPTVAVAVVVEDGGSLGSEATGGRLAAPVARDMMRAVLGR